MGYLSAKGEGNQFSKHVPHFGDFTRSSGRFSLNWLFNPPLAPNFGGGREVMIKVAKKAVRAILRNADVNDE